MSLNVRLGSPAQADAGVRARLRDAYAGEVDRLSALLGRDLHHWVA
jgi:hypothetical protein